MGSRLAFRLWLPVVLAVFAGFAGVLAAAYMNFNTRPMYVGRTTIIQSAHISSIAHGPDESDGVKDLIAIAGSKELASAVAAKLNDLGTQHSAAEIAKAKSFVPVKDTYIVAIEVTLPDAREAKMAADVYADELKKLYDRINHLSPDQRGLNTIDPACVRQVDQHKSLKLALGFIIGLVAGVVVGLILALVTPIKTKESSFAE